MSSTVFDAASGLIASAWSVWSHLPWWAWLGVVAILADAGNRTFKTWTKHRERMAMISMGMHPDSGAADGAGVKPYAPEATEV